MKIQRDFWALQDVSFQVDPGTVLGVIGPNGAGKTTLLKILSRITPPTTGRAMLQGKVIPLLEMGAAFQPHLTGGENIHLSAALFGVSRAGVRERFDEIVRFAELGDFIDLPLSRYSTGMYLRLAFSMAINMRPDVLLADEVLAVGDIAFQERCLERVAQAGREGMTVLFVSHDMNAIRRLCHRVLWLHEGHVVEIGDTDGVVDRYQEAALSHVAAERKGRALETTRSPFGEIVSVHLAGPAGESVGSVRLDHEFSLVVRFRAQASPVRVRCAIDVIAKGVCAFRAVQPEEVLLDSPGVYAFSARVPAHLLADTFYGVSVAVHVRQNQEPETLVYQQALSFRAYDVQAATSARGTYDGRMAGLVMPRLEWSTKAEQ